MKKSRRRDREGEDGRLAPRKQAALDAIKAYWGKHGIPPSRLDVARALGLETSSATDGHIHGLVRAGKIELVPGAGARAIRLVHDGEVPLITGLGEIPETERLWMDARRVDRIAAVLANRFTPRPHFFVLLASKELSALGLDRDDLVAVREMRHTPDEAVVVGRLDGQITVGSFRRIERKYIELTRFDRSGTARTRLVNLTLHDFTVEGVVVGAIRGAEVPLEKAKGEG